MKTGTILIILEVVFDATLKIAKAALEMKEKQEGIIMTEKTKYKKKKVKKLFEEAKMETAGGTIILEYLEMMMLEMMKFM